MNKVVICILSIHCFVPNILTSHFESEKENHYHLGFKQQKRVNWKLFDAIKMGSNKEVRSALKSHADINARDSNDETPLMSAIRQGNAAIVKELFAHKPNLNLKNHEGNTALHIAAQDGDVKLVQMLISAHARLNEKNNEGKTPLMRAVEFEHHEVIQQLLEFGASEKIANDLDADKTIYDYAGKNPQVLKAIKDGLAARGHYKKEVSEQVTQRLLKDITNIVGEYSAPE